MRATLRPSPCRWGHIWQTSQLIQDSLIWYKSMYIPCISSKCTKYNHGLSNYPVLIMYMFLPNYPP